jgi:SAM-dependent methyltransferase
MTIPIGDAYDVIFLSDALEHFADPVMVLRRLRQLLVPGGWLVLNTPNLDSKLLDLFGPTWSHWQAPYHRILLGRRGVRELARSTDFRVLRLRTYTDPYPATASVALNEAGLGAVIPAGAKFSDQQSSRGAKAAGWARTLWDWRGRGDSLYALLKGT